MLHDLHALLQFRRPTEVVDVGANPIDGEPPYKELLRAGLCNVTGFEPQAEALAALNEKKTARETYLPYAVGDGRPKTLNICQYSGWTSTLKPSARSLGVFSVFEESAKIVGTAAIETRRLDDIDEVSHVDFLKIDIQGGELEVFQNAARKLAKAAVIQTEVSFVDLYDGQPTLGDVDIELRKQGFIPHTFAEMKNAIIAPFIANNDPWVPLRQVLEADLVYIKDIRDPDRLDDDQLRHMCLIAHGCYGSFDLAYRCILILQERKSIPAGSGPRYMERLNAMLQAAASA